MRIDTLVTQEGFEGIFLWESWGHGDVFILLLFLSSRLGSTVRLSRLPGRILLLFVTLGDGRQFAFVSILFSCLLRLLHLLEPVRSHADKTTWMIPVFAASTCFSCSETKTLEHCTLLLERIIVALATAEPIAEVVIVLVVHIGLLG